MRRAGRHPDADHVPRGQRPHDHAQAPRLVEYSNITLTRGITDDAELWEWAKQSLDGRVERKNGSIVLLDDTGREKLRWNFVNGWPSKWTGPVSTPRARKWPSNS
jgi:phage tail-like protein